MVEFFHTIVSFVAAFSIWALLMMVNIPALL
jgi:hypothetical protein